MSSIDSSRLRRRLRWAYIGCGLAIFAWLAPEDNAVLPPVLLGAFTATLATAAWALRRWNGKTTGTPAWALGRWHGQGLSAHYFVILMTGLGLLAGLGTSVITAALMLLKNAQHGHIFPDYPLGLVGAILARAPLWALAGALAGFGSALLWKAVSDFAVRDEPACRKSDSA